MWPSSVKACEFVKIRRSCPTCVFEALGDLGPIEISLDLDHDQPARSVEGENIRDTAGAEPRLPRHREERLTCEALEVVPEQGLDLRFVYVGGAA